MEFPYGSLRSKAFLLTITPENFLTVDPTIFYDSLTGKNFDSDKITRIHKAFKVSGCKSLYGFLTHYLFIDVLLLAQIIVKSIDSFFDQGINYILQGLYTISSVAYSR
jgi:hypothetical protein